ncbi:hypothetical protein [uncultured Bacteroides sp.]|uniref:tetratricopeptide repeat protein n=1 Tax=uncultured Bacteroides sp. TaxID=162156 RepID=UPI002AAB3A4E|nr:hypothetical protein [uncultured Bacteroides sp.]
MRIIRYIILVIALTSSLLGCTPQPEATRLLEQANQLLDKEEADSALRLIDSIYYPEKSFRKEQYMQYLVSRVRARYKTMHNIASDSSIFAAWDYYHKTMDNPRWTALAAFYSGCVYSEQKNLNKAMHAYTESLTEAIKTQDNKLKGLVQNGIGDLLEQQGFYEQALRAYQKTNKLYWHNSKDKIASISNEGRSYLLMDETDSALIVFQHGIKLAEKKKDKNGESLLMQNISLAYSQKQEYKQALRAIQRSFQLNTDSAEILRYYVNFGKLYTFLGMKDSASYYYDHVKSKVEKLTNHYLQASTYLALANWEKSRKNYAAAFEYINKRALSIENIMHDRNRSSVLDIEKKYDFELLKNTHDKQIIHLQSWLLLLAALLVVSGGTFTIYTIRRKNQMITSQQTINTLKSMNQELSTSIYLHNADLHNAVLVQCDIAKKIIRFNQDIEKYESLQTSPVQMMQRINKIFYGEKKIEEQWETILKSINLVRPGFAKQIETRFPNLSVYEFRICLLTYAGFKIQEIAIILNQKPNTIQTRRSSIRRKMGLEAGAEIADFLDRNLN